MVLVDSGASHNFIATALVEELGLPTISTKEFGVMLGTWVEIRATGVCRQVNLSLTELGIIADFFPIPLGSSEVSLGYHWLASLGESHVNWGAMPMRFKVGEKRMQLQGDPSLCKTQVFLRYMMCAIQIEGEGVLLDFGQLTFLSIDENSQAEGPTTLQQ